MSIPVLLTPFVLSLASWEAEASASSSSSMDLGFQLTWSPFEFIY